MSVMLPFEHNVPIQSYSHFVFYLGILAGRGVDVYPYMFNHFLSFCFLKATAQVGFLEMPKALQVFRLRPFSRDLAAPVSFFKRTLDDGKYVNVHLNHKYISASVREKDYVHDFLLYGYSDETQSFYSKGYVFDGEHAFLINSAFELPYAEAEKSYRATGAKANMFANNYIIDVRKDPGEKLQKAKIRRDLFFYLHDLIPSTPLMPVNRHVYASLQATLERAPDLIMDFPLWKTMEDRAAFLLEFERRLGLEPEKQAKCEKMKGILYAAQIYMALYGARAEFSEERKNKVVRTLSGNLTAVGELEPEIMRDLYLAMK